MGISYTSIYTEREERPCDSCGRRARCAPNKRFGGSICGICASGIAHAAQRVTSDIQSASPPASERRGVTQFRSRKATCALEIVRELERAYLAFRRFPSAETRKQLMRAMDDRLSALAQ